jgi:hypothetical protein
MADLKLSPGGRRYGYLKNPPDHRDFGLLHPASPIDMRVVARPKFSDNVVYMPKFRRDQGQEGSCTGHADSMNRNFLYNRLKVYEPVITPPANFSPAFAYWMGRKEDGSLGQGDCGSTGRSVALGSIHNGICLEADMPYVAGQFATPPSAAALASGLRFKHGAFHMVTSVDDALTCLASGYGLLLGFNVYDSFENDIGPNGLMPTPNYSTESLQGGHEVYIFDYSDTWLMGDGTTGGVVIANSWGEAWGKHGDFFMSYKQLADPNIVLDLTLQHLGKPWLAKVQFTESNKAA